MWPPTGAIFCGGQSRRMGTPKAGIVLPSGWTMVEHVYRALKAVCRNVILVGHADGIPKSLRHLPQISDRFQNIGPMGGLEILLSSGIDSEYLITPCDLPEAVPDLFRLLISSELNGSAVLAHYNEEMTDVSFEPMIGRYTASLLPLVREFIAQRRFTMLSFIKEANAKKIEVPPRLFFALKNANTPKDLVTG